MSECSPELCYPQRQEMSQTLKTAKGQKDEIKDSKETTLNNSLLYKSQE